MNGSAKFHSAMAQYGYSNEELERLGSVHGRFETGIAPWAAWESENSSFGKTFREWAFYPKIFPLYLSSDHGVHWESRCWPNETDSPFKTFFTWNKKKSNLLQKNFGKVSYHVPHPWIFYRKKHFSRIPSDRQGTLVFYAHSNDTTTPVYKDLDQYIGDLKALPDKYQPIVICLSVHDIKKGLHKDLRKYDVPLVTAGTTNSQNFVDRFYSLLYQFRFATSSNVGSHTFYILEAGIPFFLYGPHPEFQIKGSQFVQDGTQNLHDYGDDEDIAEFAKLKELLSSPVDEVTPQQYSSVSKYLGLDSEATRLRASLIVWAGLFWHLPELMATYQLLARKLISKIIR